MLYASVPLPDYLVQFVRWDESPTDPESAPRAVGYYSGGGLGILKYWGSDGVFAKVPPGWGPGGFRIF